VALVALVALVAPDVLMLQELMVRNNLLPWAKNNLADKPEDKLACKLEEVLLAMKPSKHTYSLIKAMQNI
jgi:hypothetical protein